MNTNNQHPSQLTDSQCQQINGGIIGPILQIVEFAHGILIAREATNWLGKLWVEGCRGVDEHDYFTRFFCTPFVD